jgi:ribulose-phosphate 3-epimerase
MTQIAPSILACDFARIADEMKRAEDAGADQLHVDVMDGHFVRNITIGPLIVEAVRRSTSLHLNTHLMIDNPELFAADFVNAGSDCVLVHPEAAGDPAAALEKIRAGKCKRGIALSPGTSPESAASFLNDIDFLLVMSVDPGWGGQAFMPEVLPKFARAKALCAPGTVTGIDGGINLETGAAAVKAGCDVLIAGTFLFRSDDMRGRMAKLRSAGKES